MDPLPNFVAALPSAKSEVRDCRRNDRLHWLTGRQTPATRWRREGAIADMQMCRQRRWRRRAAGARATCGCAGSCQKGKEGEDCDQQR